MDPNSNWSRVKFCMVLCGTWPEELLEEKYRTFYKVLKIFPTLYFTIFMYTLSHGLYTVISNGDLQQLPPSASLYIVYLIIMIKTVLSRFGGIQSMVKKCVEHDNFLYKTKDETVHKIRNGYIRKAKSCMNGFMVFTPCLGIMFIITHFMEFYLFWNKEKAKVMNRQLPYYSYLPFDTNKHYLSGLLINAITCYFAVMFYVSYDCMLIGFLFSISIKLQVLQNFLRNLHKYAKNIRQIYKELTEDEAVFVAIRLCIIEHQNIIKSVYSLNSYINFLLFLEFFTNSMQLAANLLTIIDLQIGAIFFFVFTFLIQRVTEVLILHYTADEIKSQSLNLPQAICDSNYYNFNKKSKDCLRLMLLASQKPLILTIGPFGEMSLVPALRIFKTAYTIITFVQHTRHN